MTQKRAYVCGPLTDLPKEDHARIKGFYSTIADTCLEVMGVRGFAPHEHYDPMKFTHFTPREVDAAERNQVCNETSVVIAVYIAPSWGSGIEVEMARQSGVPVIIICPEGKKISRLLLGNESVVRVYHYKNEAEALEWLKAPLSNLQNLKKHPL